jgi:hypothetical protein
MSREWEYTGLIPDRLMMAVEGLSDDDARFLATEATRLGQMVAPKLTGRSSRNFTPIWGEGFFGIKFMDNHVWFQEAGINPFTMRSLAGKTIPLWVNDPTGETARKNPKAKKRITADGRHQVLIFRRAAAIGSRRTEMRQGRFVDVPASYPGAPGRISRREPPGVIRRGSRVGGRIARHNVGVRWRHPGLPRRGFLRRALIDTAEYHGYPVGPIRDAWGRFR